MRVAPLPGSVQLLASTCYRPGRVYVRQSPAHYCRFRRFPAMATNHVRASLELVARGHRQGYWRLIPCE